MAVPGSWSTRRSGRCNGRRPRKGEGGRRETERKNGEGQRRRSRCPSPFAPLPPLPASDLVSEPTRQRHHVAWVLLVAEEQATLAEGGAPEREREYLPQLRDQMHLDLLAHLLREVLEVRLVLLR